MKEKRRASPQKAKEQVPQCGFKEAHILAVVNKGRDEREKSTCTQQKQTGEQVPQRGLKEALV